MDAAPGARRMIAMTVPIVTELPPVLEPVTADTFLGAVQPLAGLAPVSTRRIVD